MERQHTGRQRRSRHTYALAPEQIITLSFLGAKLLLVHHARALGDSQFVIPFVMENLIQEEIGSLVVTRVTMDETSFAAARAEGRELNLISVEQINAHLNHDEARMKKRPFNLLGTILALAVILAIAFLSGPLLDRLFLPWAFDSADRPALPGVWVGTLTTATGGQRGVMLEMYLPEPSGRRGLRRDWRSDPYGELAGTLQMCGEDGQMRSYTIEGEPEDREASRLHFYSTPVEEPAPEGLTSNWFNGTWDGADKLDFTVTFHWAKDGAAISGADYPDTNAPATLAMSRGDETEFQAICAEI